MVTQQTANRQVAPATQQQTPLGSYSGPGSNAVGGQGKRKIYRNTGTESTSVYASITNTVSGSAQLKKCPAASLQELHS